MRKFIKVFLAFWKGYAMAPEVTWDDEDKKELNKILSSYTGSKLMVKLKNQSFEQDRIATLDCRNTKWQAGVAVGFRIAIAEIEVSSTISGATTATVGEYETIDDGPGFNRFAQHNQAGDEE